MQGLESLLPKWETQWKDQCDSTEVAHVVYDLYEDYNIEAMLQPEMCWYNTLAMDTVYTHTQTQLAVILLFWR